MAEFAGRAAARVHSPATVTLGVLAAGAGLGAAYALSAYAIGPGALPIVAIATAALALGIWRLEYGIALLILVTPFVENAAIADPGAAPLRVALSAWLVVLVVVDLGRQAAANERLRAPPLAWVAVAFLLVTLVAVGQAPDVPGAAATFLGTVGAIALYLLIATRLRDWDRLRPVLAAVLVVGFAVSVHSIWQYLTGDLTEVGSFLTSEGELEERIASVFSHPNQLGGFLAVVVAAAFGLTRVFESRAAQSGSLVVGITALVALSFTLSRGALIAVLALVLVYAGLRRAWPIVAVILAGLVFFAPSVLEDRLSGIGDADGPEVATRLDLWEAGLETFAANPLTGVGLDGYGAAYVELERTGETYLGLGSPFAVPETAHNLYINTLAEQGLLGLAGLLALLAGIAVLCVSMARSGSQRTRAAGVMLAGVLVVVLVHNMFDLTLFDPKTSVLVWTLIGVGAAMARLPEKGDPTWSR